MYYAPRYIGNQPVNRSYQNTDRLLPPILKKAFDLIYRQGYQATSIDEIIATTDLTKGALFYHFKNKEEMGLAIINEVMYPGLIGYMSMPLSRTADIRKDLYGMMENLLLQVPFFKVEDGCPAVNLIDEMAPLNKSFRKALARIVKRAGTNPGAHGR